MTLVTCEASEALETYYNWYSLVIVMILMTSLSVVTVRNQLQRKEVVTWGPKAET